MINLFRATVASLLLTPCMLLGDDKEHSDFPGLKYRSIGPGAGGRVSRVAGVAGDPLTYYAATASGGVWKSEDGGIKFKPIFDDQPCSSIGSIVVAPSDPNVVYVGTGEANIRGNVAAGVGIFKSTDAGKTWKHVWKQVGHIGTMAVDPRNPDIAFAAVLGHAFGPNPERGVYRTRNGGKSWERVLFKDVDTGASDVCIDPNNPRIVFAGLWQARRRPWELTSGGPGSGLHVSRDGGDTWELIGPTAKQDKEKDNGLPAGPWGKVTIAIAPSNSTRIYALIEAEKGGLYRSDDGGEKWERVSDNHLITQRIWYFGTLTVDPQNPDVVWAPQVPLLKSIDGGRTFTRIKGPHHGDLHDAWIDPKNPKRMIVANDGGVDVTTTGGASWYAAPLPICQFYHVACDNSLPYRVMGCMQDMGTANGPSNSLCKEGILLGDWHSVGGGEAGFAVPDPFDPNIVYAGEYGGYISRYDQRTRQARNISVYPYNASGHGAEDLRYRFQWTAPIMVSQHDRALYHAGNVLFRSRDGGQTWQPISPDLTRNDKQKLKWSGGPITGDNTGVEVYCTIFAIAESPRQTGILWAGSDDGLVHVSRDNGITWQNVTPNVPGLPDWGTVACIEPSPHDAGTAYLVVDAHRLDDYHPYLWKTSDYGKTWDRLNDGLLPDVYLHAVREDPKKRGLLYLGTERGVSWSSDDGKNWKPLKLNLPTVAVQDLVVKDNDLVVGTNGRSLWILDDLTPLREFSSSIAAKGPHLFSVQPTVRWRYHSVVTSHEERGAGENPPGGAIVSYYLKGKPKKPLTLEIKNARGERVAFFDAKNAKPESDDDDENPEAPRPDIPAEPGVNRFVWDLLHPGAKMISGAKVDTGNPGRGPFVAPGTYKVFLTIDGKVISTNLDVMIDPRLAAAPTPEFARAANQSQVTPTRRDPTKSAYQRLLQQYLEDKARNPANWIEPEPRPELAPVPRVIGKETSEPRFDLLKRFDEELRKSGVDVDTIPRTGPVPRTIPVQTETAPAPREAKKPRLPLLIPPIGGPAGAVSMEIYQWLLLQDPRDADVKRLRELLERVPPLRFDLGPEPRPVGSEKGPIPRPAVARDAQEQLALRLRDDVSKVTSLVEQVRMIRKQLKLHAELLKNEPKAKELLKQGKAVLKKLDDLEAKLHNPRAKVVYDILAQRGGAKLYSQFIFLMEAVAFGDGPPTQGAKELAIELEKELYTLTHAVEALGANEVTRLNELAKPIGAPTIWISAR